MTTPGTVDELMSPPQGKSWAESVTAPKDGPAFSRLTSKLPKLTGLVTTATAFAAISGKIPDLLHLDLGVILVGGWKKIQELRAYTNREKYGPDETILVELTRHTISSSHKPTLDILLNDAKIDTVPFELKMTFVIDGAVLTVRDGRIHAVAPGACKGSLELKCEGFPILKREPATLRLPVAWTFSEPIAIPGAATPPA